jgi:RNA polymerase sigma-70 factor (ECF subfamily)
MMHLTNKERLGMTPEQEAAAIRRARADPRAFVDLYDYYFPRIHAYVNYRVNDQQDAEDIISDVFLSAMRGIKRFRPTHGNSFAAWLFRIAHNRIIDHYKRHDRDEVSLDPKTPAMEAVSLLGAPLTSRTPRPEEALTQQETFEQMRALLATLSPRRQEVITLRFFGGLRNQEIAVILGLDERTIASHLSRGLQDLRNLYAGQTTTTSMEEVTV